MNTLRRKNFGVIIALVVMFSFALLLGTACAEDMVLDKKIERVQIRKDRNGSEYVRIFVKDSASLNGVKYDKTVSVFAFGDTIGQAKTLKKGTMLHAIVEKRDFRGSPSYTLLKLL